MNVLDRCRTIARLSLVVVLTALPLAGPVAAEAERPADASGTRDITRLASDTGEVEAQMETCVANMEDIRRAILRDLDERPTGTAVSVKHLLSKGYLAAAPRCPAVDSDQYTIVIGSSMNGHVRVDVRCPGPHGALSRPRLGK